MASKIPRYTKTQNPVRSQEYRKILRTVKEKKALIAEQDAQLKLLQSKLAPNTVEKPAKDQVDTSLNTCKIFSNARTVIVTPGGSKRKVKASYRVLKDQLKDALLNVVEKTPGRDLLVNKLIEKLHHDIPAVKIMPQKSLLSSISSILEVNVKRKGKKRELYYPDLSLKRQYIERSLEAIEIGDENSATNAKSPLHKQRIVDYCDQSERQCRGRLAFSDSTDLNEQSELATHLEDLEITSTEVDRGLGESFHKLQQELQNAHNCMELMSNRTAGLENENQRLQDALQNLEESFNNYQEQAQCVQNLQGGIINLYKDILDEGELLGGILSISERNAMRDEVKRAKAIFNLGLRTNEVKDLIQTINPFIFNEMVNQLKNECPIITNILEQLVISENTSRNIKKTAQMKMKAAIHLLSSLMDVRSQKGGNDVSVLFGMLCLCYGAGPSMIGILQHLGLSESFQLLVSILRQQLDNYKKIIELRVCDRNPVITYQDNMQVKRTSLRHLRLSKLQRSKLKQGKMWDFTVRGWRASDISGIEEMFDHVDETTKPQRDLSELDYIDTKIESNKEHQIKWISFKNRNLLRKLDLGLNKIQLSSDEIKSATNELLHSHVTSEKQNKFVIDVPPPDEEFPHLGEKYSEIYPLPISHENQCTNYGVASNLDLFKSEFGFHTTEVKKNLSLKKNKKEYNLEHAYERYAFMKALEHHRQVQSEYERVLRGQDATDNVAFDDSTLVTEDTEPEDNESDIDEN